MGSAHRRKPCVALAVALALGGCDKRPATEETPKPLTEEERLRAPWNWTAPSPNLQAHLTQEAIRPDLCQLKCTRAEEVVWSAPGCLGRADDFVFVSNDCEHAVVVFEYPKRADPWEATVVARGFQRAEQVREYHAQRFLRDPAAYDLRKGHLRWLAGVLGERGRAPRPRPDGEGVHFDVLDGGRHSVPFEDATPQDPRPGASQPLPGDEKAFYEWTDAKGRVRVSQGLQTIPREFRDAARRVSGTRPDSRR